MIHGFGLVTIQNVLSETFLLAQIENVLVCA